jgi:hypothetical protein
MLEAKIEQGFKVIEDEILIQGTEIDPRQRRLACQDIP